jgi:hypothetical protein
MIISASIIWKPRKKWHCDECGKDQIEGPAVRLYGAAHHGDPPYIIKLHPMCINPHWANREPKLKNVFVELLKKEQARAAKFNEIGVGL